MTNYVNKEYYKSLSSNDRAYILVNSDNVNDVMNRLSSAGLAFSAVIGDYRNTITVSKADEKRAREIAGTTSPPMNKIIGNTEYRYIADKKYINTDRETALQIANILSGDNRIQFSGRIQGERATITVSGNENAETVRRMLDNIRNADFMEDLRNIGYERTADTNGFVNIRNTVTGETAGFSSLDEVRLQFADTENEFFHPTEYEVRTAYYPRSTEYYIARIDAVSGSEKAYDETLPHSENVRDVLNFAKNNGINLHNPAEDIEKMLIASDSSEIEKTNLDYFQNNSENMPRIGGEYADVFDFTDNKLNWTIYDPDNCEFTVKTYTPEVIAGFLYDVRNNRYDFIDALEHSGEERFVTVDDADFISVMQNYTDPKNDRYYGIAKNSPDLDEVTKLHSYVEDLFAKGTARMPEPEQTESRYDEYGFLKGDESPETEKSASAMIFDTVESKLYYEHSHFIEDILEKEKADIINNAYEIDWKRNILEHFSEISDRYSENEQKALLSSDNLLDEVYSEWLSQDSESVDDLKYSFDAVAQHRLMALARQAELDSLTPDQRERRAITDELENLHDVSRLADRMNDTAMKELVDKDIADKEQELAEFDKAHSDNGIVWNIVHESDDENENPTTWAAEVSDPEWGRFVWIEKSENGYDVSIDNGSSINVINTFSSLYDAQNFVEDETESRKNNEENLETEDEQERTVDLINAYAQCTFESNADFSNLNNVPLAMRSDRSDGITTNVYADLENMKIIKEYDGNIAHEDNFESLSEMNKALENIDFESLLSLTDEEKIYAVLDLQNRSLMFTFVDIDERKQFILDGAVDETAITVSDKYLDYLDEVTEEIADTIDEGVITAHYESYIIGNGSEENDSIDRYLSEKEREYIRNHSDVIKESADLLDYGDFSDRAKPEREEEIEEDFEEEPAAPVSEFENARKLTEDILRTIEENRDGYHFNMKNAVDTLLESHSTEEVSKALAVYTLNYRDDGRISRANIEWADKILPDGLEPRAFNSYIFLETRSHPVVINGYTETFREKLLEFEKEQKENTEQGIKISKGIITLTDGTVLDLNLRDYTIKADGSEYVGGMDENGHEAKDNFRARTDILHISLNDSGKFEVTPETGNYYDDIPQEYDPDNSDDMKNLADRLYDLTYYADYVHISEAERTPQKTFKAYIVPDMKAFSHPEGMNERQRERRFIERFDNISDAVSRFNELRPLDYNSETDTPYARLTLGLSDGANTELDVIQVRTGKNYLVDDFTRHPELAGSKAFTDILSDISAKIPLDRVEADEKDIAFSDWNNNFFDYRYSEPETILELRITNSEFDDPYCIAKVDSDGIFADYLRNRRNDIMTFPSISAALEYADLYGLKVRNELETPLETAKRFINDFCVGEYNSEADFSDLHNVSIAYTTLTDDELPIQVTADLVEHKMTYEFDGEVFNTDRYDSLDDMIENALMGLDFSDLVYVPDDVAERHSQKTAPQEEPKRDEFITIRKSGNFYEMYGKNAEIAADVLGLHLSSKNGSPMTGFPESLKSEYSKKLSDAGYYVLVEQVFEINPPKRENDRAKPLPEKLSVGDTFIYNGREEEITDLKGLYPGEVVITHTESAGNSHYEVTSNIDRDKLINEGVYIGNPIRDHEEERNRLITDEVIKRGTGFVNGRQRVAEFYRDNRNKKDFVKSFAKMLSKEYGTGGHSGEGDVKMVSYDSKGIAIELADRTERYSWERIAKVISDCIESGEYLPGFSLVPENAVQSGYTPKIGDMVSLDDTDYSITDISDGKITLTELGTFLAETRVMSLADFLTADMEVIEENTVGQTADEIEQISDDTEQTAEEILESEPVSVEPEPPAKSVEKTISEPEEEKPKGINFKIRDDNFGIPGGAKARFEDNINAIKTLKAVESENRLATPEEQEILAKYTGWGAIPQAFDSDNGSWKDEYDALKELLTDDEYRAARASTLNAHFTSPVVINAIYEAFRNFGIENAKVLEPSAGIGNFIGAKPDDMNLKFSAVELDSISGRIAHQLYPNEDVRINGFEKTHFKDNSFDAAVGNVPFGSYRLNDPKYNDKNFLIHDYFFIKSLDKVHQGGIVTFVTSSGTLDKANYAARQYIAERAELIGAVRLPNNTFKANAGAEVTSDIIFLQKRDRPITINNETAPWVGLPDRDGNIKSGNIDGFGVNKYFEEHPDMILGHLENDSNPFSSGVKVVADEGQNLKELLHEAVSKLNAQYRKSEIGRNVSAGDEIPALPDSRMYSLYAVNGAIYYREDGETMTKTNLKGETAKRAAGLIGLRDNIHELLDLQINNSDGSLDEDIADSRENLNRRYDEFTAKYGNVSDSKNARAMKGDDGYSLVNALEIKDNEGNVTGKADIFTKNTIKPKEIIEYVESAEEALLLSVAECGKVDFDYMTSLCGMDKETLISELKGQIYRLPVEGEKYVTADEYLTGNIRKKLAELDFAPNGRDVSENRAALEKAIPEPVEAKDISVKLGAHWVDPVYIRQFIIEKFKPDWRARSEMTVEYSKAAGVWKIDNVNGNSKKNYIATSLYGTPCMNAYEICEQILNNGSLQVKDRKKDENGFDIRDSKGNYVLVVNEEETKAVKRMANKIQSEFKDWIFADPERRETLVKKYNEVYNSIRHREYDGSHLKFIGMNPDITLREHQLNAVARGLYGGNTMLAHCVGAGKSYEMIAIAMEGKRLGLHTKSLFAVPNSLTDQIGNDFRKLYPAANILVATKKDFEKKNRQKLLGKIAAKDWDAIIVGHTQFDKMSLSPALEKRYINEELDKLREELDNARDENGKKSFTVKQIERSIESYERRLKDIKDELKDGFVDFEQLGIDKLFIDESHLYKNLATATKMQNVAGIGTNGSQRAMSLLMKAKYLDEKTGSRGLCLSSGTPVSNSMTELYTLMRYLQANMLNDLGIQHFDEWAADFGEIKTEYELKPESDGKYQLKTRFAQFTNLPELMGIFKEVADIKTKDTLDLDTPDVERQDIAASPSKIQKRAIKALSKRATKIRGGGVDPKTDNMLLITNDGRKIGLDQRLLDPNFPDDPNSKVNMCIANVLDIYNETAEKRSTQLIFCDMSTPKSEARQDRFIIYRDNDDGEPEVVRKKTGLPKNEDGEKYSDDDFMNVKAYAGENGDSDGKLRKGDIVVIRKPDEDEENIVSTAAVYDGSKFDTSQSEELLDRLMIPPIDEMPPKEFNIYDDIRDKLISKGVKPEEIAFIHDFDTAEKKQELFNRMNEGDVRILLGSTAKCGAGMNAQKKMIALHHLDAPMRPSDMEQREGRIERQGNENSSVKIFRYVTDKTFDSFLYQMLESKQRFISQIMTSKTPERVCSDIDEQALDYAEVKALCAGNPLIREEMELKSQIKDLTSEKNRFNEHRYKLQDDIRIKYPQQISTLETTVEKNAHDFEKAQQGAVEYADEKGDTRSDYPLTINGKSHLNRREAGQAIKDVVSRNYSRLASDKNTLSIGEYRGFKLNIFYDVLTNTMKMCMQGEKPHYIDLNISTDIGNMQRMDNAIANIAKENTGLTEKISTLKSELEQMKVDVAAEFPKAAELAKLEHRLNDVQDELTKFELTDDSLAKELFDRLTETFSDVMCGDRPLQNAFIGDNTDKVSVSMDGNIFTFRKSFVTNSEPTVYAFAIDYENKKVQLAGYKDSLQAQSFDIHAAPTPESVKQINAILADMDDLLDVIDERGMSLDCNIMCINNFKDAHEI